MKKKNIIINILLIIISITFTILVKLIDVKPLGLNNSKIGFSTINTKIFNFLGTNKICYNITEVFGILAILVVLIYGLTGLYQLIKRKSLLKIDKEIIYMGFFYVAVIILYVLFEKVVINYRPVLEDGVMEASYPSSHTLLTLCVCGSAILFNKKVFKNTHKSKYKQNYEKKYIKVANILLLIIAILTPILRLISGVHWFTDIIGGILISIAMLSTFNNVINYEKK